MISAFDKDHLIILNFFQEKYIDLYVLACQNK